MLGAAELGAVLATSPQLRKISMLLIERLREFVWMEQQQQSRWCRIGLRAVCEFSRRLHVIRIESNPNPRVPRAARITAAGQVSQGPFRWLPALVRNNCDSLVDCQTDDTFKLSRELLIALCYCTRLEAFNFRLKAFNYSSVVWMRIEHIITINAETLKSFVFPHTLPANMVEAFATQRCECAESLSEIYVL